MSIDRFKGYDNRETCAPDGEFVYYTDHAAELATLAARVEEYRKDAERFRKLQNMPHIEAQALFWNFTSRKQRAATIDALADAGRAR